MTKFNIDIGSALSSKSLMKIKVILMFLLH